MDLDDFINFPRIDPSNMLAEIEHLPDQLMEGWEIGNLCKLPDVKQIKAIVAAGMGGSAIAGDLVSAYLEDTLLVPCVVHRNYDLPEWVRGSDVLVIISSHSGDTEEALSAFDAALERKCPVVALSTGGELSARAEGHRCPVWKFEHQGQPRAAIGYTFAMLLNLLYRLELIQNPLPALKKANEEMKLQQETIQASCPVRENTAKRLAGQMAGRIVNVFGADFLAPVARRWKTQLNELAKAWSQFDELPEANHNAIAGSQNPTEQINKLFALFLMASNEKARNRRRLELQRESYLLEGMCTDIYEAKGSSKLSQMWTAIHFGDYTAYYLAMLYGVDPTPIETITWLKNSLKQAS